MPASDATPLAPPKPVHFDAGQDVWVVSRYADVLAGLRQPDFLPVGARGSDEPPYHTEEEHQQMRADAERAVSPEKVEAWRQEFERQTRVLIDHLPLDRTVDLVQELAFPCGLALAVTVTGVDPATAADLAEAAGTVCDRAAAPENTDLARRAVSADAELTRHFVAEDKAFGPPTFVALSQTVPRLLANAWLALFRNPEELASLRAKPDLMPRAVEELLRYAGLARVLHRRAAADVSFRGVSITEGERVDLMIHSANHDPQQFSMPQRLDLTRRPAGQLSLGAAGHACVGAPLIRMAMTVATAAWLPAFGTAKRTGSVEWLGGSGFRWPASLVVKH